MEHCTPVVGTGHCIDGYDAWVERTAQHYFHTCTVHDLGNGQKEVLIRRCDVRHDERGLRPYYSLSQAEKDEQNQQRAARRAKSQIRRRVKAMGLNALLTLTYKENQQCEETMKRHLEEFVRRLRRVIPGFCYVVGYERQKRGAFHAHMAVHHIQSHFMQSGVRVKSFDLIRAVWRSVVGSLGGNIDLQKKRRNSRKTVAQLAAYISKYMTKAFSEGEKYSKRWSASRFSMPESETAYYKNANIKQLIAEAVALHAPEGTQIRCTFLDERRGFFFTVEPAAPLCP